ncbi:CAP domain-containing protein [Deinococcus hohokamensis]|uniref:CAP domain-containing protein n=1 Tax=Deinococcus hohokamensis TaxID=309883 RepID=A0ABV9IAM8_9DEIO
MWKRAWRAVGWTAALLLTGILAMGWAGWLPDWPLFSSSPLAMAPSLPPDATTSSTPARPRDPVSGVAQQPAPLPEEEAGPIPAPTAEPGAAPPEAEVSEPGLSAATPGPAVAPRRGKEASAPARLASPAPPDSTPGPPTSAALSAVNRVRTLAGLAPVSWQSAWAAQCAAHARYLVKADRAEHREDPASPYRSAQGEACAHGHYFVSSQPASGATRALGYWATGAFHLPQLLHPGLRQVALGEAHDAAGSFESAAVLDVRRGLTQDGPAPYPVRFPAPGATSPYREAARQEWPDPLSGCGYAAPAGAPIALLLGPGPAVQAAALKVNGQPVEACLLTAERFEADGAGDQAAGRSVLASQGAAVLLPRQPLPPGAQVQVSFRTPAGREHWSFRVDPAAP